MFVKESSPGLLTLLEKLMKFHKKILFYCKESIFFANVIGLGTCDIAQFEHILLFGKMKVVRYL